MTKKTAIIAIIPARMAATRFPGKPMMPISGIPMIGHVYFRCRMSQLLDDVVVATCDQEIFNYIRSIGGMAIMTSNNHQRASDRAAEAMTKYERSVGRKVRIAVMVQGDEPLLRPAMIDSVVRPLRRSKELQISNLMSRLHSVDEQQDPNEVKVVVDKENRALYFSREAIPSQKKWKGAVLAWKQIGIIAFKRDFLLRFLQLPQTSLEKIESVDMLRVLEYGYRIQMVPVSVTTYGVDTPQDLQDVECLMAQDSIFQRYRKGQQGKDGVI